MDKSPEKQNPNLISRARGYPHADIKIIENFTISLIPMEFLFSYSLEISRPSGHQHAGITIIGTMLQSEIYFQVYFRRHFRMD